MGHYGVSAGLKGGFRSQVFRCVSLKSAIFPVVVFAVLVAMMMVIAWSYQWRVGDDDSGLEADSDLRRWRATMNLTMAPDPIHH